MYLDPLDENVTRLLERDVTGPVTMLNLLLFRDAADYAANPELDPGHSISGRDAYERYVVHTMPFLEASGGSVVYRGDGGHLFIGPPGERWDHAMLIHQASISDFFAFAENVDYLTGIGHRTAALLDSRLLPLTDRAEG